ncbi:GtrA family protein [Escherichia coli]|uniref:GtrA family protein n=1 Tax=Escherichia coli TaxID=562 RepID=UPI0039867C42
MLKLFAKCSIVGPPNSLIHWVVFGVCIYGLSTSQALANFAGFVVAVSFSFYANARFTFKASTSTLRYMLFVAFAECPGVTVGWAADRCGLPPIIAVMTASTPGAFCATSVSRFIVFREAK